MKSFSRVAFYLYVGLVFVAGLVIALDSSASAGEPGTPRMLAGVVAGLPWSATFVAAYFFAGGHKAFGPTALLLSIWACWTCSWINIWWMDRWIARVSEPAPHADETPEIDADGKIEGVHNLILTEPEYRQDSRATPTSVFIITLAVVLAFGLILFLIS